MSPTAEPQPGTVLVVGETLIDIVETEAADAASAAPPGEAREFIGGSPANVAMGLARLGHPTRLLTRIGRDARGERIAAHLAAERVGLLEESVTSAPTSTARAIIGADGAADYRFDIDWRVSEMLPAPVDLVHAGSIALFLEPGGSSVLRLLGGLGGSALVTLDPNIRPSLLPSRRTALLRFEAAARTADLVKLSDEDAAWLYPALSPEAAARRILDLGPRIVAVTLGGRGALAVHRTGVTRVPARAVEVVDTISAGDSFMASLASSLLELGVEEAATALPDVLDRAARAAAIAVSVAGANPPRREQLDAADIVRVDGRD